MLGFARNIVSFRVKGRSIGEKIWLACATVAGVVNLAWTHAGSARALELRSQVTCCLFLLTLRRCAIVFCNSVSADRSVVAVFRFLAAAAACVIILSLQLRIVNRSVLKLLQQGCEWCFGTRFFAIFVLLSLLLTCLVQNAPTPNLFSALA